MKRLGIDIGSTTVKVAVIDEEHNILFSEYKRHFANIKETLKELVEHARSLEMLKLLLRSPVPVDLHWHRSSGFRLSRRLSVYQKL